MLRVLEKLRGQSFAVNVQSYRQAAKTVPGPLSSMETWTGMEAAGSGAYPLGVMATEYLIARAGLASIPAFYRFIGSGHPWTDAFSMAFGLTPTAFYSEFSTYWSTQ